MTTWQYVQNGQSFGPVSTATLQDLIKCGALSGDTLVWREGLTNWVPVQFVPELNAAGAIPASAPAGTPPVSPTVASGDADIENNKVFAILAYVGPLLLVPLLAAPKSPYARFHANQGIVLFLATVILTFACLILLAVPIVNVIAALAKFLIALASVGLMVVGIVNAASGKLERLPWIGHFEIVK